MYRNIKLDEAMSMSNKIIIDVRSPGEFNEVTIPGAINIPLLDNVERSLVGTVYKHEGITAARELAMCIISPKLPAIIRGIKEVAQEKAIVLFCWRGGERSSFMASILDFMGYKVYRLVGGFKAHRHYVREYLERDKLPLKAVVLYGLTGVGKTEALNRLAQKGMPVLDLEGLSCNRGSVFGKIGMPPTPGQKTFEALIVEKLKNAEPYGLFVVECESYRLGRLYVPPSIMNAIENGYKILLYDSLEGRIERIKKMYTPGNNKDLIEALRNSFNRLVKRLGKTKVNDLMKLIESGKIELAIKHLLLKYYDPLYGYPDSPDNSFALSLSTKDMRNAVSQIEAFLGGLPEFREPFTGGGVPNRYRTNIKNSSGEQGDISGSRRGIDQDKEEIFNCFRAKQF